MIQDWYEVWVDESIEIPYVLFLRPNQDNPKEILIIDPRENNKPIKTMPNYESAKLWLQEDEYTLVKGRMES
jgi:hypothetical protein